MSEPKRTPLISINAGKKDKSRKVFDKTIRFDVTLPESTEEEYPEYDYNALLRSAEKQQAIKKKRREANGHGNNGLADLDSDDDQEALKEIARHFEQKYGGNTRLQNLSELAVGYDESDSFIDNSEAVEEALSENVTTKYGGFYINCGALELKNVKSLSDDDTDSVHGNNKKYKRLLNTIEEESDSDENEKSPPSSPAGSAPSITNNGDHPKVPSKKETFSTGNGEETWRKKRKLLNNTSEQLNNKKRNADPFEENSSKTVKELLREKREKQGQRSTPETASIAKESIDDAIESVVNASRALHDKQNKGSTTSAVVSNSLPNTSSKTNSTTISISSTTPSLTPTNLAQNTANNPSNNNALLETSKSKISTKQINSEIKLNSNSIAISTSSSSVSTTPTIVSNNLPSKSSVSNANTKTSQAFITNSSNNGKAAQPSSTTNSSSIIKSQSQPVIVANKVTQQTSVNNPLTGKTAVPSLNTNVGKIAQTHPVVATSKISQSSTASSDDDSDSSTSSSDSSSSDSDESGDEKEEKDQNSAKEATPPPPSPVNVPLPNGLSEDILKLVESLKEVASQASERKFKFFNSEVNNILLDLEKRTRNLSSATRLEIFGYLAQFSPCTKLTLARRAKKLLLQSLEGKISINIKKLQETINKMKPTVLSNYSKLCINLAEANPQFYWELSKYYWTIGDGDMSELPNELKSKLPPRKFPWNHELRRLMDIIIKTKSQTFDKSKPRKLEQHLKMYLETEIKILWPTGWMTVNELLEEARNYRPMPRKQNKDKPKINNTAPKSSEKVSIPLIKETSKNTPTYLKKETLEIQSLPTDLSRNNLKSISNSTKTTKIPSKMELVHSGPSELSGIATQSNSLVDNSENKQLISSVKQPKINAHDRSEISPQVAKRPKLEPSNSLQIETVFIPQVESLKKLNQESDPLSTDPLSLDIPSFKPEPEHSFPHVIEPVSHHINVSKHMKIKSDLEIHSSKTKSKTPPSLSPSVSISAVTIRDTNSIYSKSSTNNQQNNHRTQIKVKSPGITKASDLSISSSHRSTPEHGVIQKTPSTLTMVNIPDCISITPSQPTHTTQTSPSSRPMSLKHRILQETALSRLENDGIEVIEILPENKSLSKSQSKTPSPQPQVQQQQQQQQQHQQQQHHHQQQQQQIHHHHLQSHHQQTTPRSSKHKQAKQHKIQKSEIVKPTSSPQPHPISSSLKIHSTSNEIEETAAATNLLSQIIKDTLSDEKVVQEPQIPQPPPIPPKIETKPKEDLVQLEVDRVMKELMILQGKVEREKSPEVVEVVRNSVSDKLALRSDLYLRNEFQEDFQKHIFSEKSPRISTTNSILASPPRSRNRTELPTTHTSPYFRQSSPSNEPFSLSLGSRITNSAPPPQINENKPEPGSLPDFISNIPTGDDPFSLPQFFSPFGQSFSGSNQHSSPY